MALDATRADLVVGIVGAGAMGRGIAQIAATAGIRVPLYDVRQETTGEAAAFVKKKLWRAVEKGRMDEAAAKEAWNRIEPVGALQAFAPCHVVIESIVEDLEVKQNLFRRLEEIVERNCILATNTSSLSVTAIASACRRAGRVGGMHFFSPVPSVWLVEVVSGMLTEPWVGESLSGLAGRMGRHPVMVADTPGFIVNHADRGYSTEALRIVDEGVASFADVDRIMCDAVGFRMGPFQVFDLIGLDVSQLATESIYHQYFEEPRYRPSPFARNRMAAELFGRKTGQGFYRYEDATADMPAEAPAPEARPASVWLSPAEPGGHAILSKLLATLDAPLESGDRPSAQALCLVTPLGDDATTTALAQALDPKRTVAVDTLFGLDRRRTLMAPPVIDPECIAAARGLLGSDGVPVTVINDSPGFVAQRIVAMIVNVGCDMAQQRIASPQDIDLAVKLGLAYPHGPLTFGDELGAARVFDILAAMQRFYGDPRYRPSPWLTRRAKLGATLLTPEYQAG